MFISSFIICWEFICFILELLRRYRLEHCQFRRIFDLFSFINLFIGNYH